MRWLVLATALLVSGCGSSSPSAPSGQQPPGDFLPFAEAFYVLQFLGDSQQCGDIKNPQAGTAVSSRVMLRRDGTAWTAANGGGTLALRFEATAGASGPFGIGLTGTARGFADDEGTLFDPRFSVPPNGTRITIADVAALSGAVPSGRVTDFSQGTINGSVTFSRNGITSTCPAGAVGWTMNRLP